MQSLILAGILLLAFAARSYHLDFPVSGFQAWRQADTAAMARNYYKQGFHFLYPQVDWGGGGWLRGNGVSPLPVHDRSAVPIVWFA